MSEEAVEIKVQTEEEEKWTNVQVDSQVLSLFMAFPQKYEYVFVRHLQPLGKKSKFIRRGSIVHDGLLKYWKVRIREVDNYQLAVQECVAQIKEGLSKEDDFDAEFKLETLQGTVAYLKHLQSSSWIPIEAEKYFKLKIYED